MINASKECFISGILSLCFKIEDCKILRRVWKILDRTYTSQLAAGNDGSAAKNAERIALIGDIGRRLGSMDVEKLRRVDWYMDKIGA